MLSNFIALRRVYIAGRCAYFLKDLRLRSNLSVVRHMSSDTLKVNISEKNDVKSTTNTNDQFVVTIKDVKKEIRKPKHPEYVPKKYFSKELDQETIRHLRWMLQKDVLGQDMFLMGAPGVKRRNLALAFLELIEREVEYIALSRDTTEADLKQRKEIEAGTASYHDQCAVRAAVNGRLLILEGIEKAERNVLPVLNNLLENREMHLEDGRFLIPANRYDELLKQHSQEELDFWRLVRVSEDFRVIALGLPAPRYPGHPLDPPLRSRFQARHIQQTSFHNQLKTMTNLAPNADPANLSKLLSCCHALITEEAVALGLPDFPLDNLNSAAKLMDQFPHLSVHQVFYRFYPYDLFLNQEGRAAVKSILNTFDVVEKSKTQSEMTSKVLNVEKKDSSANVQISVDGSSINASLLCGDRKLSSDVHFVETSYQNTLIANMLQSLAASDVCLVGPRGCGKSITVAKLAEILGYSIEPVVLYQDMTSRDLIQQRTTLPSGDTIWKESRLITAALEGKLAVLDGIHRVHSSTLAVIYRLIHDREIQLHDGTRLLRSDRYDQIKSEHNMSNEDMDRSGILRIHPSFRIIALAEPSAENSTQWLNSELLNLFLFHEMRPLDKIEEINIMKEKFGEPSTSLLKVIDLAHTLRSSSDPTLKSLSNSLSTRQLLRIAAKMQKFKSESAYDAIQRACLARFLPPVAKQALEECLKKLNISPIVEQDQTEMKYTYDENFVTIGDTTVPRFKTKALTKVPNILFYDVPQHLILLESLLQDFHLNENLLLVGNQGVGKNKIADRLLQLLNKPREYIQLHRDTTVQTLTVQPMVKDGVVVYEDSPLVQAVRNGHVLVVDEADKAPIHVTCILKTLVESGEMNLSDGRRIVPSSYSETTSGPNEIITHPDFRMVVLSNRPGFPFLGNDFFGALGDLFSTHSVDNPKFDSEIKLLKQYGPDVDDRIIMKLVKAFGELRNKSDQGLVSYPYSTREVVNIVKHLQKFPDESLSTVVQNVFDFDRYSQEVYETLVEVLHKHGIPIGTSSKNVNLARNISLPKVTKVGTWELPTSRVVIPVQERFVKSKFLTTAKQLEHTLDRIEARSAWFTELQSYWSLPSSENAIIVGVAASKTDNSVHILRTNPTSIFSMNFETDQIKETVLQGLITPVRSSKPLYSIVCDKDGIVIVHEETSNTLLFINNEDHSVHGVQLFSFLESAGDKLSQAFGGRAYAWKMIPDLILSNNQLVLYTPHDTKIETINLQSMSVHSMVLPFEISSLTLASENKWLLQSTTGDKFVLEKAAGDKHCPNILKEVDDYSSDTRKLGEFLTMNKDRLSGRALSEALNQSIDSPNRILVSDASYANVIVGFPDLSSNIEIYTWPREGSVKSLTSPIITDQGEIIRTIRQNQVANTLIKNEPRTQNASGFLELVDVRNQKARYIPVPRTFDRISPILEWIYPEGAPVYVASTPNDGLVTVDASGCVQLWETALANIEQSLGSWRKTIGEDGEEMQITKERYSGLDVSGPKHGKVDQNNEPHVGGNTWAGGTGGRDTAGLGGKGGPYRLDAGHTVHQLSDEEKNTVPEHVKKAAREMGQRAFKQRLKEIQMSEDDFNLYNQFSSAVQKQVQTLRTILGSLQAKSNERQWGRHQTSGELDDTKIIESLTGEQTIYRRRVEKKPEIGSAQMKPKRLKLVVDVSGSMYRFNGYDGRLDREMEACVMVMEAFSGYEAKFQYDIVGHSGEDYNICFVDHTQPPKDNKQRLKVIKTMHAHAQFCMPGDHTLDATRHAISSLAKEDSDESIVIVLSDANLERYGIKPERFTKILSSNPDINAYAIFIGSLGDQATRLIKKMPSGRAFVCMDLKDIPKIMQQIFASSMLSTTRN